MDFYKSREAAGKIFWDYQLWLEQFRAKPSGSDHYRALRRQVWKSTTKIVQDGEYISCNGMSVSFDQEMISKAWLETVFHPDTREIKIRDNNKYNSMECFAIKADCLETSRLLQLAGYNPAVLNMANRHNPGGWVQGGSGAQEENIFRRSTAFCSLFQFVPYAQEYEIPLHQEHGYPIPRESGGIYSPHLLVFRSSETTGYYLLDSPYSIDLITVPAINKPNTETVNSMLQIARYLIEPSKEKIRAILRIGFFHGNDALVLSAFGCGAFANPPEHMASLFREVLDEEEFRNAFRLIVFAIIDDHNAHRRHNPEGNLLPFQREFNRCLDMDADI